MGDTLVEALHIVKLLTLEERVALETYLLRLGIGETGDMVKIKLALPRLDAETIRAVRIIVESYAGQTLLS